MKILAIGDFHGKFPNKLKSLVKKESIDLVVSVGDFGGIRDWYSYLMKAFEKINKGEPWPSAKEYFGKEKYKQLLKKDEIAEKKVLSAINNLDTKVIFVFGNTDDEWYNYPFDNKILSIKKSYKNFVKKLKNMKDITYSKTKFKKINFIGLGGYMDIDEYLKEEIGNDDKERKQRIKKRREKTKKRLFDNIKKTKGNRIFVFHYPPKGSFDIIKGKKNPRKGTSAGVNFFLESIKKYKPSLVICGHMHEYQGKKKIGKSIVINPGAAVDGKAAIIDYDEEKGKVKGVKFIK